ncbi:MAG: hypothetical protein Nkreftii_000785 [Candidatus Nitrospira kreftii]|uniref:Uncharacterized protein n=1 Tax=Candidatus Nitrospira kreftii TaxID=2652173 RepID=A0A7S8FBY7_9BACT|nr:MAG: hypothetical protein Nkreftii_000785 [Candidatus Nitrospira kreftii]
MRASYDGRFKNNAWFKTDVLPDAENRGSQTNSTFVTRCGLRHVCGLVRSMYLRRELGAEQRFC